MGKKERLKDKIRDIGKKLGSPDRQQRLSTVNYENQRSNFLNLLEQLREFHKNEEEEVL